jgi:universal bacterial protein YeaZ
VQVLAIDCAQRFCSAALYDAGGDRVRASSSLDIGRGHAERLPGVVDDVLSNAGATLGEVDRIAVTVGPGSFAGIRVGVAFARGLALALSVPAVGVSSLLAIGAPVAQREGRPVLAALDAGRGRLWAAVVAPDAAFLEPPVEMGPEDASHLLAAHGQFLVGNSGTLLRAAAAGLFAEGVEIRETALEAPDIAEVARIGARLDPAANSAEPVYLRAADAKPQAGFAVARSA